MAKTDAETARELARLSSDCSFLLTHLVRQNDGISDRCAKNRLLSILGVNPKSKPCLRASPVGWYRDSLSTHVFDPSTYKFDGYREPAAVCFTESTLSGLKAHHKIFDSRYGVAFDRDMLFSRGANPCLNIKESLLKAPLKVRGKESQKHIYNFIPWQLHPFVNIIHESFDATHEREWRHPGDLVFDCPDAWFVFCPEEDFSDFCSIQSSGYPVLFDLEWLDRL